MMRSITTTLLVACAALCTAGNRASAQSFKLWLEPAETTINKSGETDLLREYVLRYEPRADDSLKDYTVSILPDAAGTTLPASDYALNAPSIKFADLKTANTFYLKVRKDSLEDRLRSLRFRLAVTDGAGNSVDAGRNTGDSTRQMLALTIRSVRYDNLDGYRYLAYVGTNFDLVDGPQTSKLFFATNIFIPRYDVTTGFSVSLYGNRTFTATDTSGYVRYTSSARAFGADSARFYTSTARFVRTRVSDNLGAVFSPLFRMGRKGKWSRQDAPIQLYYSPQLEFIWRRTTVISAYDDIALADSSTTLRPAGFAPQDGPQLRLTNSYNVYDFYFSPVGLTAVHETSEVSVRLFGGFGYNSRYLPRGRAADGINTAYERDHDWSFTARIWVTHSGTGITLQAEVFNNINNPQPYYGVTLSKALNFRSLGTIFAPVTAR